MEYAVAASINVIHYFTMIQFFDAFLLRKYIGWKFWSLILVWAIAFFSLLTFLTSPAMSWQKVVLVLIMTFILSLVLYKGDLPSKLFLSIMSYALFNAVCYVLVFVSMLFFRVSYEQLIEDRLLYIITGVTGALCALFVAQLIKHFHAPTAQGKSRGLWVLITIIFPFSSILVLFLLYSVVTPLESQPADKSFYAVIVIIVLAFSNIIITFLIDALRQSTEEHEMLVAISEREKMQQESLNALSTAYTSQRSLTHDFRRHISVLSDFLNANRTAEAIHYLDQLHEQQTERVLLVNTHNAAIDAILNQKGYAAQKYNIDIRFEVNDLSAIKIKPIDCTVVIGNLLDNAIEACQKLVKAKRWIQVSVLYAAASDGEIGNLFVSVLNPSLPVKIVNNTIATTKPNPSFHGFGLRNVKDILSKYQAEYCLSYEDGQFVFSIDWPDIIL